MSGGARTPSGAIRAIACPDKFRGSLTAPEAADAMTRGLERAGVTPRAVPMADGGEGTLDVLVKAAGGSRRRTRVSGPLGQPVEAEYGMLPGRVAVVEMARASGLDLVGDRNDPLAASTRGTGELVVAAARAGARRVIVGVGGSATTDGGLGTVEALRWSLVGIDVVVACDVETLFLDAARVYGPQKGATEKEVALLTRRLEALADDYRARTGIDVTSRVGAGAAGGLAGGLAALGARLESGFRVVADTVGLLDAFSEAGLVLTGEGRLDASSFEGKVVGRVLSAASDAEVRRLGVVAGAVTEEGRARVPSGVEVRSLMERAYDADEAVERAALLVEEASLDAARALLV